MASDQARSRPSPSLPHAALQSLPSGRALPRARAKKGEGDRTVALDGSGDVELVVRALLVEILGLPKDRVAGFDDETELFGALSEFDSMAVATLLTELEERLGILIEDEDV